MQRPRSPEFSERAARALADHTRAVVERAPDPSPEQMQRLRELLPPPRRAAVPAVAVAVEIEQSADTAAVEPGQIAA